jgi:hypothetical protein
MKKQYRLLSFALGLAMLPALSSCDDNDIVEQTPLPSPTGTTYTATFNSIDCSWDRVDGATSYGYEFTDAAGNVITRSVTTTPSLSFTDLSYSTVYYLNVWAYGAYGSADGTSAANSYEMRTNDLTPLATPVLATKKSTNNRVQFSWTCDDSSLVDYYVYTLYKPDGTVQTTNQRTNTSVTITLSPSTPGTYTFTLKAYVKSDYAYPNGEYCDSETASITYEVEGSTTPVAP